LQNCKFGCVPGGKAFLAQRGGTTPIINRSKCEGIFIPLPPPSEQQHIVKKLEELVQHRDAFEQSKKF